MKLMKRTKILNYVKMQRKKKVKEKSYEIAALKEQLIGKE